MSGLFLEIWTGFSVVGLPEEESLKFLVFLVLFTTDPAACQLPTTKMKSNPVPAPPRPAC